MRGNHDSRRRAQEGLVARRHEVGAKQIRASLFLALLLARRLAGSHHPLERFLERLCVGGPGGVEDHQVGGNPLHAPVLLRPQELSHDVPLLVPLDEDQGDGKVAGDAVGPEAGRAAAVRSEDRRRCAQRGIGVEQTVGETLEEMRLVLGDPEVVQLDLCLGPGQRALSLEGCRLAVLLGELERLVSGRRQEGGEREANRCSFGNRQPLTQAHDGIQNRPDRVREGAAVEHGQWRPDPAAPAQEARAVALVLQRRGRLPLDGGQVSEPDLPLVGRTRASGRKQGSELGNELRLHEEVREGGVGLVRALGSQDDLCVGGEVDLTIPVPDVGHRQLAELGVVLGGHDDLEGDGQGAVSLHDLGPVLGIDDLVVVDLRSTRLEAGGPDVPGVGIAQEDEGAPAVARRVLPPAGDGEVVPAAEAGARCRDHDR
ncbi:MAG: hypothetical protein P8Y21_15305, partial [Gemmatimonadales bacterium]